MAAASGTANRASGSECPATANSQTLGDTVLKIREAAFDVPVPEEAFRRKNTEK
jgi:hypothetical protein